MAADLAVFFNHEDHEGQEDPIYPAFMCFMVH
jgi:hypothetical protein